MFRRAVPPALVGAPAGDPSWQQPGGLGIEERRSWSVWQLATFVAVSIVVGAIVGHTGGKAGTTGGEQRALFTLPPVSSQGTASSPTTAAAAPGTTAASATTAPTAGPSTVLAPNVNGTGPRALPPFSAGPSWTIGWAFRCVLASNGTGTFQVVVVPEGGPPSTAAAVDQSGREGHGTTPQSRPGRQHLEVRTDPACNWAVKVTGTPG